MTYSPVELRHVHLARGLFGYRRKATHRVLDDVADSFEDVWRERADLADKVEHLEAELQRYRELEALLRATMVSAERSADELREQSRREADLILTEAHAEARAVARRAATERERLVGQAQRIRAQLRSALEIVEDVDLAKPAPREVEAA